MLPLRVSWPSVRELRGVNAKYTELLKKQGSVKKLEGPYAELIKAFKTSAPMLFEDAHLRPDKVDASCSFAKSNVYSSNSAIANGTVVVAGSTETHDISEVRYRCEELLSAQIKFISRDELLRDYPRLTTVLQDREIKAVVRIVKDSIPRHGKSDRLLVVLSYIFGSALVKEQESLQLEDVDVVTSVDRASMSRLLSFARWKAGQRETACQPVGSSRASSSAAAPTNDISLFSCMCGMSKAINAHGAFHRRSGVLVLLGGDCEKFLSARRAPRISLRSVKAVLRAVIEDQMSYQQSLTLFTDLLAPLVSNVGQINVPILVTERFEMLATLRDEALLGSRVMGEPLVGETTLFAANRARSDARPRLLGFLHAYRCCEHLMANLVGVVPRRLALFAPGFDSVLKHEIGGDPARDQDSKLGIDRDQDKSISLALAVIHAFESFQQPVDADPDGWLLRTAKVVGQRTVDYRKECNYVSASQRGAYARTGLSDATLRERCRDAMALADELRREQEEREAAE